VILRCRLNHVNRVIASGTIWYTDEFLIVFHCNDGHRWWDKAKCWSKNQFFSCSFLHNSFYWKPLQIFLQRYSQPKVFVTTEPGSWPTMWCRQIVFTQLNGNISDVWRPICSLKSYLDTTAFILLATSCTLVKIVVFWPLIQYRDCIPPLDLSTTCKAFVVAQDNTHSVWS